MSTRKPRQAAASSSPTFTKINVHAAGIDIGASEHWVCIDPGLDPHPIRRFGAFTDDLRELVGWLKARGVTTVAMEATGIYWINLYRLVQEAGIEVLLADPRQTRNPRQRKSDMQDCQVIWEKHAYGLLDKAFVPEERVQTLRTYLRFRQSRVEQAGKALVEMQAALSAMNIKLQHVISDIGGDTGMRIIKAIVVDGERDPAVLATLRDRRCRNSVEVIARSLTGTWREEHLFQLRQAYDLYRFHQQAIAACDANIDVAIRAMGKASDTPPALTRKPVRGKHLFSFDAQEATAALTGVDLVGIDGIGPMTVLNLLGEIGFDISPWPTSKHFCAWLRLCPNPKKSGGKVLGHIRTTANRAAQILRNAAMGLDHPAKTGPLAAFFRRVAARRGRAAAITATAHRLARIIYALMRDRKPFDRMKLEPILSPKAQARLLKRLQAQAQKLGMTLTRAA